METPDVLRAWFAILKGRRPVLSVEITNKCPLRCPGCYAYEEDHLGGQVTLRSLADYKGDELVRRVLELVDRTCPLYVSIVGGDPLVRYRELSTLVPELLHRGVQVQVVTSAFRPLPPGWNRLSRLSVVVSIDGLPAEHNARRAPATYDRILRNIAGERITIHCTITGQMMKRPGYLKEFLEFWTPRTEIHRVWFSLFTPQKGDHLPEILSAVERRQAIADLIRLRVEFPKLDMSESLIAHFAAPPESPRECVFAQTTESITADLKTRISPCQFGGDPDCSSCGCMASIGMSELAKRRLAGIIPLGALFRASLAIGRMSAQRTATPASEAALHVLP